jgi:hypothetical protein
MQRGRMEGLHGIPGIYLRSVGSQIDVAEAERRSGMVVVIHILEFPGYSISLTC